MEIKHTVGHEPVTSCFMVSLLTPVPLVHHWRVFFKSDSDIFSHASSVTLGQYWPVWSTGRSRLKHLNFFMDCHEIRNSGSVVIMLVDPWTFHLAPPSGQNINVSYFNNNLVYDQKSAKAVHILVHLLICALRWISNVSNMGNYSC